MKIVAFLQNQWFKDPEGVKAMFAEHPECRERYIEAFLFMGCLTGKRLRAVFGEELCNQIVWEEISPEIGGHSASKFPPDPAHIERVLRKHAPDVVLCFGKLATNGVLATLSNPELRDLPHGFDLVHGPHPAARNGALDGLRVMQKQVARQLSRSANE